MISSEAKAPPQQGSCSGWAVWSLVFAGISLLGGAILLVPAALAVALGHLAVVHCKKNPEVCGRKRGIIGLVVGYVSLVVALYFNFGPPSRDPLPIDLDKASRIVSEWVPEGTTLWNARKSLEGHRFICRVERDVSGKKVTLYGVIHGPGLVTSYEWLVSFSVRGGRVFGMKLNGELLAP